MENTTNETAPHNVTRLAIAIAILLVEDARRLGNRLEEPSDDVNDVPDTFSEQLADVSHEGAPDDDPTADMVRVTTTDGTVYEVHVHRVLA